MNGLKFFVIEGRSLQDWFTILAAVLSRRTYDMLEQTLWRRLLSGLPFVVLLSLLPLTKETAGLIIFMR